MSAAPIALFVKDPGATLDYAMDWTAWLKGDIITASSWTVPLGISNGGVIRGDSVTGIILASGTDGTVYDISNTVTTAGGRIDKRTIRIQVSSR